MGSANAEQDEQKRNEDEKRNVRLMVTEAMGRTATRLKFVGFTRIVHFVRRAGQQQP